MADNKDRTQYHDREILNLVYDEQTNTLKTQGTGDASGNDTDGNPVTDANLLIKIDKVDENNQYVGQAKLGSATSGAVWQIMKIEKSSTVTSILYADGDSDFDNVWDNRASISYS